MAKTPKLTAVTPQGTFTRGTWHQYTHVVVLHTQGGKPAKALAWSRSQKGAEAQLHYWDHQLRNIVPREISIFPVESKPVFKCGQCNRELDPWNLPNECECGRVVKRG